MGVELSLYDILKNGGIAGARAAAEARELDFAKRAANQQADLNQQEFGRAAAALNLNAPDIGAIALAGRANPQQASTMLSEVARRRSPGYQQDLQNAQLSGQATAQGIGLAAAQDMRAQQALEMDRQRTTAYIGNMNYDNAVKVTASNLQALQGNLKSEADLRAEYQKAPLMVKGVQAVGSWQMMKRALDENNEMALQAAIVAAAQIQEPGLAVRNDDRIAYSGNNPVVDRLVQTFNTAMSGEGLTPGTKQRLLALGTRLAGVHAQNVRQVTSEYQKLAVNTPGARMDQITAGTGVDWDTVDFLIEMNQNPNDSRGPGGR